MNNNYIKVFLVATVVFFHNCLPVFAAEQIASFEEKHQDKDAILLEYNDTIKVNEDWSYRKEKYNKLKILKEEARSMGEIPIPYDKEKDKITELSAYTITPDGKKD